MGKTSIEWTDQSWPVLNGCRRVSPGCVNCYAERLTATRLRNTPKYTGLALYGEHGPRWTGRSQLWMKDLDMPLRLRKPSKIFVCDMGDLFFEENPFEEIAAIYGVMAASPHHTFQVLTKRPHQAAAFYAWVEQQSHGRVIPVGLLLHHAQRLTEHKRLRRIEPIVAQPWPLPNVWLGVSAEDQQRADERIPHLLGVPASVRFVSYEPALGPVDFTSIPDNVAGGQGDAVDALTGEQSYMHHGDAPELPRLPRLDWVIVGGESGPGARPFDVSWARKVIGQCRAAGVAVFMKQLGANALDSDRPVEAGGFGVVPADIRTKDRKGGNMEEWPAGEWPREFPKEA